MDVRAAIIGYGYWGRNVARAVQNSTIFELHTIFDLDLGQRREAKKLYDFKEYLSLDCILADEEIEVLFIITPPQSHYAIAKNALQANKHIFVEKPLCMCSKEAGELYDLARAKSLILHCDHIFLHAPAVRWLKQHISLLGNIVYINARRINLGLFQNSVDVIWDLAIHDLSIIDYLIGLEIKNAEVFARKYQNYPNDALANINLELESGVIVTINVSWLSPIKVREMIIGGEEKSIIYDETKSDKIALFDSGVVVKDEFDTPRLYQKMVEYKIGSTSFPKVTGKLALDTSVEEFGIKIRARDQGLLDEEHVLRILHALEKISASKI